MFALLRAVLLDDYLWHREVPSDHLLQCHWLNVYLYQVRMKDVYICYCGDKGFLVCDIELPKWSTGNTRQRVSQLFL